MKIRDIPPDIKLLLPLKELYGQTNIQLAEVVRHVWIDLLKLEYPQSFLIDCVAALLGCQPYEIENVLVSRGKDGQEQEKDKDQDQD